MAFQDTEESTGGGAFPGAGTGPSTGITPGAGVFPGAGMGGGRGMGRGMMGGGFPGMPYGTGATSPPMSRDQELEFLKNQAQTLNQQLDQKNKKVKN